ncbi:MAG: hypothetical protein RL610_860 [Pseudomonadota bacterium]|jgi:hypothetical protein
MGIRMEVKEYEAPSGTMVDQYGEEIMWAGWNPTVAPVSHPQLLEPVGKDDAMPADLVAVGVKLFLCRMCAYQN